MTDDRIARALFWSAIAAGASYWPAGHFVASPLTLLVWKGAGVTLLAMYAARVARGPDGWTLAGVLALGALGDVALAAMGLQAGAAAFLMGHLLALTLYRPGRWGSVAGGAAAVAIAAGLLSGSGAAAIYALALGAMATAAGTSRFSRLVAAGAALFVVSDLLIFARIGVLAGSAWPDLLVWPLYFAGQAMIAWGVTATLLAEETATPTSRA